MTMGRELDSIKRRTARDLTLVVVALVMILIVYLVQLAIGK